MPLVQVQKDDKCANDRDPATRSAIVPGLRSSIWTHTAPRMMGSVELEPASVGFWHCGELSPALQVEVLLLSVELDRCARVLVTLCIASMPLSMAS